MTNNDLGKIYRRCKNCRYYKSCNNYKASTKHESDYNLTDSTDRMFYLIDMAFENDDPIFGIISQ